MILLHFSDPVTIEQYQLSVFECKRLQPIRQDSHEAGDRSRAARERQRDDVRKDLAKLDRVRQHFGGPFGRSYWLLSGGYKLAQEDEARIREFGITLWRGSQIDQIAKSPDKLGLPPLGCQPRTHDATRD